MIDPHIDDHAPVSISHSTLRQFAGLCLLIFSGLTGWQYFGYNQQRLALIFAGLAAVLGFGGLVWPRGIRPVFVTAMALTMPIGWVVSHVLLGVLFFGLFTPVGLFFKLIGRDALCRRFAPEQASYWEPKPGATDVRSYLRQS
jgi:saxitoxin biosynthesis operon SxtJ-like protein